VDEKEGNCDHQSQSCSDSAIAVTQADEVFGSDRIAQQVNEAFPWNEAPRYLIRDQDT